MATPTTPPTQASLMVVQDLYDTDMGDMTLDVSGLTRKFPNSIVVKQDPNKEGALSFLKSWEDSLPSRPTMQAPQTMRPRQRQGGY